MLCRLHFLLPSGGADVVHLLSFFALQAFVTVYKADNYPQSTQTVEWSSLAQQLPHSTSCSAFYPSKSPLMATLIIIEVVLLMAVALFKLYLMANFILYFGILVAAAMFESDNACGIVAVVKRKAKEIAATSKCYIIVHLNTVAMWIPLSRSMQLL